MVPAVVLDGMDLTDAQWTILAPLLPTPRVRRDRRGRPWRDPRDVLNGILWILRTGAPWKDLPDRYPSYQTCHRRFQRWVRAGTLRHVLKALAADLHARGGLDLSETFIDGSFASAKKRAPRRQNQARQGDQDHGHCRPRWSSCRHYHRLGVAARNAARRANPKRQLPR